MDGNNNQNFIVAIGLSIVVLVIWQLMYAGPKMREEQVRREQAAKIEQSKQKPGAAPAPITGTAPQPGGNTPTAGTTGTPPLASGIGTASREAALAGSERVAIKTDSIKGSIALKGGRIDDLTLLRYHETTKPSSPNVTLFSPSGSATPYYAEYGWTATGETKVKLPGKDTVWRAASPGPLTPATPVSLEWDNGEGVTFRRTISIDDDYMFTVRQEVDNRTDTNLTFFPYALISRHGTPQTTGFYILHEGLIGVFGEQGLQEIDYDEAIEEKAFTFNENGGWLGITDKYWAAVLVPNQKAKYQARFTGQDQANTQYYQADYLLGAVSIPSGTKHAVEGKLFAGAKRVQLVDGYEKDFGIEKFELLIDWGWFYFITKPLFYAIDFFYKLIGNFGVSILIVTVLIKLIFFPLANKSYVSMSKMKKLQPEMKRLQERFKDDRARQQQALMELYQKEKVNPMSGCLPILVQIPVFFALYKVLFVSIEMRHAPFFGWIQDLSAPDPTSLFNLFGLIPWTPPEFLAIGIWPIIMGMSMWVQMKLNPAPTDPVQQKVFAWMPLFFTFLLARFPAGLVIYWTWNNILSVTQQYLIMTRQGVKVELWDNLKESLSWINGKLKRDKATGG